MSSLPSLPLVKGTDPERAALDSFRTAVAVQVADTLRIPLDQAYQAVDIGRKNCDFSVPIPRLQPKISDPALKALDAKQLVQKVVKDVSYYPFIRDLNTLSRYLTGIFFYAPVYSK